MPAGASCVQFPVGLPQTLETPPPPHVCGAAHVPQSKLAPQPSDITPQSVTAADTGAVAATQRINGAMRLNVHVDVLALDGVYVREDASGALVFHLLPAPTRGEVTEVARRKRPA